MSKWISCDCKLPVSLESPVVDSDVYYVRSSIVYLAIYEVCLVELHDVFVKNAISKWEHVEASLRL